MKEIRCTNCKKKLADVSGESTEINKDTPLIQIKCPRCKTLNLAVV